jgi:hypothetical protein
MYFVRCSSVARCSEEGPDVFQVARQRFVTRMHETEATVQRRDPQGLFAFVPDEHARTPQLSQGKISVGRRNVHRAEVRPVDVELEQLAPLSAEYSSRPAFATRSTAPRTALTPSSLWAARSTCFDCVASSHRSSIGETSKGNSHAVNSTQQSSGLERLKVGQQMR